jgi:hypothetical protein
MADDTKYCIDCKHVVLPPNGDREFARCGKFEAVTSVDRYTAPEFNQTGPLYTSTVRLDPDKCGPEANLFEAKP